MTPFPIQKRKEEGERKGKEKKEGREGGKMPMCNVIPHIKRERREEREKGRGEKGKGRRKVRERRPRLREASNCHVCFGGKRRR